MGTDLVGWVEVRPDPESAYKVTRETWHGVIKADNILGRNYDMFGCLFGIGNYANFSPVVGLRGLPSNLSEEAQDDFLKYETYAESWITWPEIAAINWDEMAENVDGRPHQYEKGENGNLIYRSKSSPNPADKQAGHPLGQEGTTWERNGFVYRIERLSRQDALKSDWQLLFDLMATTADYFGPDHVRLVVWFDH